MPIWIALAAYFGVMFNVGNAYAVEITPYAVAAVMFVVAAAAAYGAIVFPIRYYLRRRSVMAALGKYIVSTLILFAVVMHDHGAVLPHADVGAGHRQLVPGVALPRAHRAGAPDRPGGASRVTGCSSTRAPGRIRRP